MEICRVIWGHSDLPLNEKSFLIIHLLKGRLLDLYLNSLMHVLIFKGAQHVATLPLTGFFFAMNYTQTGVFKCSLHF